MYPKFQYQNRLHVFKNEHIENDVQNITNNLIFEPHFKIEDSSKRSFGGFNQINLINFMNISNFLKINKNFRQNQDLLRCFE